MIHSIMVLLDWDRLTVQWAWGSHTHWVSGLSWQQSDWTHTIIKVVFPWDIFFKWGPKNGIWANVTNTFFVCSTKESFLKQIKKIHPKMAILLQKLSFQPFRVQSLRTKSQILLCVLTPVRSWYSIYKNTVLVILYNKDCVEMRWWP